MIKQFFSTLAIIGVSLVLISWGSVGHTKISNNASLSFNEAMSMFTSWTSYLTDHSSDADKRKTSDPTESPKHFIDIDNYSDFINTGSITQDYTAAVAKYGLSTIISNGSLPWATQAAFDSLRNCLKRNDITKAKQFAADLGHYVGDGHMPLHITKNYDGQLTGNSGIHSRYESDMIGAFNSQIIYSGASVSEITNVNQYIFNYIYANNKYKDSVLLADTYAKTQPNYNQALWNKTKGFTTILFKNASHALAELIYTAWVQSQVVAEVESPIVYTKVNNNASLSFNEEMTMFTSWTTYLTDHATDADKRKTSDPTESPKHFIDIDNYSDFISTSTITQDYTAAVAKYGLNTIISNGSLPWATQTAFDSLRNCLKRNDITKAKQFAADLGHYVADGHMPLHITKNYDGQLTDNSGIHSRYESDMIGAFNSQIVYSGESISAITNVNQYIFNYIYANYKYKDSVILADTYAKTQPNYNQALWNKTKGFTTVLFKNASHAIAELIYTAWVQSQVVADVESPIVYTKISNNASLSFNQEMTVFTSWTTYLTDHATDADKRKISDPTESPKHFIDIDNYSDFINTSTITQDYIAAVAKYGLSTINSNGTLPWATLTAFDSLRNCLKRNDITKAKQFAADLGHYVADGYMPLHITKNYNGQLTGNSGVHSRYESDMIGAFNSQIVYSGENISAITNVNQYIFNYIYANYKYKDSVILADTYAKTQSNYNQALWNKTKGFTTVLFKNASHAIAELIYTAWVQSGSTTDVQNPTFQLTETLEQNSPNPFTSYTSIRYNLNENADVVLQVKDILGNNVTTLYKGFEPAGSYVVNWTPENQNEGIYFIVLDTRKIHQVRKMILVK